MNKLTLIDVGRQPIYRVSDEGGYPLLGVPLEAIKDLEGIVRVSPAYRKQTQGRLHQTSPALS